MGFYYLPLTVLMKVMGGEPSFRASGEVAGPWIKLILQCSRGGNAQQEMRRVRSNFGSPGLIVRTGWCARWGSSNMERGASVSGYLLGTCRLQAFFTSKGKCYSTVLSKIATMAKVPPEEGFDFWVCFNVRIPKGSRHRWKGMTSSIYFPLDQKEFLQMCLVLL